MQGHRSTDQHGVSHWADPKVAASLTAALVLLAIFVVIESRSRHALMTLRIFASRSRSGAYVIMLLIATAMFEVFFFLTAPRSQLTVGPGSLRRAMLWRRRSLSGLAGSSAVHWTVPAGRARLVRPWEPHPLVIVRQAGNREDRAAEGPRAAARSHPRWHRVW